MGMRFVWPLTYELGTGIWAIDMAEKYPMAEVIGTDLRYLYQPVEKQLKADFV
jgi:hypothetical protein